MRLPGVAVLRLVGIRGVDNAPAVRAGVCYILIVLVLVAATSLSAQPSGTPLSLTDGPPVPDVLDLFLPGFLQAGYQTRAWVREQLPPASDSLDDLDRLDLIYLRALNESGFDRGEALFAALVAVFEHRTIPLSIGINLPLTLEPRESFERRVAQLPSHLFADYPDGGDRDKLQHFFSAAWLAWTSGSAPFADLVGLGVEVGEDSFVTGGANDHRDVRANRLGHLFAELLRDYPQALPSMMFRAWNREYQRRTGVK